MSWSLAFLSDVIPQSPHILHVAPELSCSMCVLASRPQCPLPMTVGWEASSLRATAWGQSLQRCWDSQTSSQEIVLSPCFSEEVGAPLRSTKLVESWCFSAWLVVGVPLVPYCLTSLACMLLFMIKDYSSALVLISPTPHIHSHQRTLVNTCVDSVFYT